MAKDFSFDLDEDMLDTLGKEFSIDAFARKFADAVKGKSAKEAERVGKAMFLQYGKDWMNRAIQLGDEHKDRIYEVAQMAIAKTGDPKFPHIPQRFIEIAYLGVQPIMSLPVIESNRHRVSYKVTDCAMFAALKKRAGDNIASLMPCKHACLVACATACQDEKVSIRMEAETSKNGYCQFLLER